MWVSFIFEAKEVMSSKPELAIIGTTMLLGYFPPNTTKTAEYPLAFAYINSLTTEKINLTDYIFK